MANVGTHYVARDFFDTENSPGLSIGATAVALTASLYAPGTTVTSATPATFALLTVETDQIRWFADGTTPTASFGHLMNVGDVIELQGTNAIVNFRAIRVTTTALLQVSYGR